jgi:hypothetical protein
MRATQELRKVCIGVFADATINGKGIGNVVPN